MQQGLWYYENSQWKVSNARDFQQIEESEDWLSRLFDVLFGWLMSKLGGEI